MFGRPTAAISSAIRTNRARMSAGRPSNSAPTLSFKVSTVHAIADYDYTRYGIAASRTKTPSQ
jgi:hypothetical protein